MNKMMKTMRTLALVTAISAAFSTSAMASEEITLKDTFPLTATGTLHLEVPVGEINLKTHEGDDIQVKVDIKPQNDSWFGDGDDIADADFEYTTKDGHLYLEIDKDKSVQSWTISMPRNANIDLDVGVGEINLNDVNADVLIDVGVGDVEVEVNHDNYATINLEAGVGDVELDGFTNAQWEKGMVGDTVRWNGSGSYKIDIEVGVGEVEVEL